MSQRAWCAAVVMLYAVMTTCALSEKSCTGPPSKELQPPERVTQEAKAIVTELGRSEYDKLYACLSRPLAKLWPKETFAANMAEVRNAVGKHWSPNRRGFFVPLIGKKYGFMYNVSDASVSDYQLHFSVLQTWDGYRIVELEARMLHLQNTPTAIEIRRTCERFLSLLAEGKAREARTMTGKPASNLLAWALLKRVGTLYKELKHGLGVSYKLHRVFAKGRCLEEVHIMEKGSEISHFRLDLEKTKEGRFLVKGFAYGVGFW